jgi:hypothetical protein
MEEEQIRDRALLCDLLKEAPDLFHRHDLKSETQLYRVVFMYNLYM